MSSVSAKIDYACQAVLALSVQHDRQQPVPMKALAEAHGIPAQFLAQIFQQLKVAGLVTSSRGSCGGYRLAQSPTSITVWDVVSIFQTPEPTKSSEIPLARAIHTLWDDVEQARRQILESTTFADLAQEVAETAEPMYYI